MKKKSTFARNSLFEGVQPTHTDVDTHEYTHTHTPTHTVKERKTRRVQLLMKESTVDSLDAYAKKYDTSRNDIIQNLVEEFLKTNV
jgi:hypothetical protein